ncbi:hypothetical protein RFI_06164 [Reticulomyxa filosa]|uniref:Uncharacterized protein n=1 Tax=Reticulomyxa filosa TaxID=46433 RepID=X6NYP4_RETFI|nr:hypothetical protein RFI_06164 [Reticulomyxa filosa]|eukprot:ETO30959.1 hypothetical protein RFI_06164 [Reticulomyxa filosa]
MMIKLWTKKQKQKQMKLTNTFASTITTQNDWDRYFNGYSIAKYVVRRVGDNKYQFLHKSCQEYYTAQKIVLDIISWEIKYYRIYDNNSIFVNLKSRLFRIIKSSKNNPNAATILNVARVNMDHQNWDKKNISHSFFEGASLKEVVLSGVSLFRDCLNGTTLRLYETLANGDAI